MSGITAKADDTFLARDLGPRGSRAAVGHADPAGDPGDSARAVLAGVGEWWRQAATVAGLSGAWLAPETAIEGLPPAPHVEHAVELGGLTGDQIGQAYVNALSEGVRARHGRHYTPPLLADHLWSVASRSVGQRLPDLPLPGLVRDPACGSAALLLPALRQHLRALAYADPRVTLAGLPGFIEGIDADPSAVWVANVVLAAEMLPVLAAIPSARRRPLPQLARVGDGLAEAEVRARIVLMNPPYGRVRLSEQDRQRWGSYLYGHANLYSLFLAAGLEGLDASGSVAALVPTSFLAGRYFTSLREQLGRQAPLWDLTFVAERDGVFAGVLQETCLAVFSRRKSKKTAVASVNGTVTHVAKVKSPRGGQPWVFPRRSDDALVAAAAAEMPLTLADAGWGASTGPLVWNRRREDLRDAPDDREREALVVWAADLDGGVAHRDPARETMRWLRLRSNDPPSILLTVPAVLVQRTTAPEQARRVVCVNFDETTLKAWGGKVVVENHVNVLRPTVPAPLISQSTLAALLATRTIDRLMRCISGSVAVSAYELKSIALPDAETLKAWEGLRNDELEQAVSTAYRPRRT